MTTTIDETDTEWATRLSLRDYRLERRYHEPFRAAVKVADGSNRHLADVMLNDDPRKNVGLAVERCRAARAIYDEVCARADIRRDGSGDKRKFHELSRREQFWSTGKLTEASA